MPEAPSRHLAVVAGLAYIERVQRLPSQFTATLKPEPDNRFNSRAVAVLVNGEKVGYLPPEISHHFWGGDPASAVECPGRLAPLSALEDSGVTILLDVACLPPSDDSD
ncbi:MAG TPA: HIRAN domain-containing protein [Vicinamibacterales bacterium]